MNILKLVKLVYLVDRQALLTFGRPVTFDHFFCMIHGPVVSSTMDCINAIPEDETTTYWSDFITPRDGHSVCLLRDPMSDQLSPAEESVVAEIYENFGRMTHWELRDYTHTLPEWKAPREKTRVPLPYGEVMKAAGWTNEDIQEVTATLEAEVNAAQVLG